MDRSMVIMRLEGLEWIFIQINFPITLLGRVSGQVG